MNYLSVILLINCIVNLNIYCDCIQSFIILQQGRTNLRSFVTSNIFLQTLKMLGKLIIVMCVVLGTVSTEPVRRSITLPNDLSTLLTSKAELLEIMTKPEMIMSIKSILKSVIGYKITALSIVIKIVNWLATNFIGIVIGGTIALGICKITGKCSLDYDESFSKLTSFITPERMEMAQNLLMNAISRFGQEDEEEEFEFE